MTDTPVRDWREFREDAEALRLRNEACRRLAKALLGIDQVIAQTEDGRVEHSYQYVVATLTTEQANRLAASLEQKLDFARLLRAIWYIGLTPEQLIDVQSLLDKGEPAPVGGLLVGDAMSRTFADAEAYADARR